MSEEFIVGRNSVLEAIKSDRPLNKILIAKGDRQGSIKSIIGLAREKGINIQEADAAKLDNLAGGMRHQGVLAFAAPVEYAEIEDIFEKAAAKNEEPFIVLLDGINDPHNVGAILRTADAAGVHGVLIPKRRSCPLTAAVTRTSAGAVEYVPVARIGNVAQTINSLKKCGMWIVGTDTEGSDAYFKQELDGPILLIIGSEGEGMGRLTKELCDILIRIPMRGRITSLNASVAASLLMYEVLRQREAKN